MLLLQEEFDFASPGADHLLAPAQRDPRRSRLAAGVLVTAGLCALVAAVALSRKSGAPLPPSVPFSEIDATMDAQLLSLHLTCEEEEKDIDYEYSQLAGVGHLDNIGSSKRCCDLCRAEEDCLAYTWVKDAKLPRGNPGQCWLKGGKYVQKAYKQGVWSAFGSSKARTQANVAPFEHDNTKPDSVISDAQTTTAKPTDEAKAKVDEPNTTAQAETTKEPEAETTKKAHHKREQAETTEQTTTEVPHPKKAVITTTFTTTTKDTTLPPPTSTRTTTTTTTEDMTYAKCANAGEGCLESKCCKDPGHQCFTKNAYWAQCMSQCIVGPNPRDQVSPMPWECKRLGNTTPGVPQECAGDGEDCRLSRCCKTGGKQCYEKNSGWASCKATCIPGADLAAPTDEPWSCRTLGPKTLPAAPWVAQTCSQGGADCRHSSCCAQPGFQCYRQSEFWAECKVKCTPGEKQQALGPVLAMRPARVAHAGVRGNRPGHEGQDRRLGPQEVQRHLRQLRKLPVLLWRGCSVLHQEQNVCPVQEQLQHGTGPRRWQQVLGVPSGGSPRLGLGGHRVPLAVLLVPLHAREI